MLRTPHILNSVKLLLEDPARSKTIQKYTLRQTQFMIKFKHIFKGFSKYLYSIRATMHSAIHANILIFKCYFQVIYLNLFIYIKKVNKHICFFYFFVVCDGYFASGRSRPKNSLQTNDITYILLCKCLKCQINTSINLYIMANCQSCK